LDVVDEFCYMESTIVLLVGISQILYRTQRLCAVRADRRRLNCAVNQEPWPCKTIPSVSNNLRHYTEVRVWHYAPGYTLKKLHTKASVQL